MIETLIKKTQLMDKIRSIDLPELALTTATRLELLIQNPAISISHADSTIEMLNAMGNKSMNEDELGHRDQESPLHVLGSLSMTILAQHLLELTCIEEPDTHERPVRKISLYPKSGNVNLLVRSNNEDHLMEFKISTNTKNLDDFIWPVFSINGNPHGSRRTINKLTYLKLILDLLALNNRSPETIDSYAESQHDWCLSSFFISGMRRKMSNSIHPDPRSHRPIELHDWILARTIITSLIYGCRGIRSSDAIRSSTVIVNDFCSDLSLVEPPRSNDAMREWLITCDFIKTVEVESFRLTLGDDDHHDANGSGSIGLGSMLNSEYGLHRIYPYRKILDAQDAIGVSTIVDFYSGMANESDHSDRLRINPIRCRSYYDRTTYGLRWASGIDFISANNICYESNIPVDLRGRVTRDRLTSLESETRFIRSALIHDALPHNMICILESILGDDDFIDPEFLEDMIANGFMGFDRVRTSTYLFHPMESFNCDSSRLVPISIMDRIMLFNTVAMKNYDDDYAMSRYHAFMKMYLIHLLVRFHEFAIIRESDSGDEITSFDQFIMNDVLRSIPVAYENGILSLDATSDWYRRLTDDCLKVILGKSELDFSGGADFLNDWDGHYRSLTGSRESAGGDHRSEHRRETDAIVASHVTDLYRRMSEDGDLHHLEEVFERLDDVLVGAIIDHYMMCLMDGLSLPCGYLLESLRMDMAAAYGEVGELVPDKGSVN